MAIRQRLCLATHLHERQTRCGGAAEKRAAGKTRSTRGRRICVSGAKTTPIDHIPAMASPISPTLRGTGVFVAVNRYREVQIERFRERGDVGKAIIHSRWSARSGWRGAGAGLHTPGGFQDGARRVHDRQLRRTWIRPCWTYRPPDAISWRAEPNALGSRRMGEMPYLPAAAACCGRPQ